MSPATKETRQAHRCLCLTQESSEHPPSLSFYSEGVWSWFNGRHFLCRSCWKCHPFHPDSNHLPTPLCFSSPLLSVSCIHRVSDSQPGPLPAHCWFNLLWWEQPARKRTWGLPDSSQTAPPPWLVPDSGSLLEGTQRSLGLTMAPFTVNLASGPWIRHSSLALLARVQFSSR